MTKKGSSKSKKTKESEKNQIENDRKLIISLLPGKLIFTEILTRLPVKSLVRCKLVSKEWESVISSPQFAKLHLRHATSSPFVRAHCFCIISLDSFHLLNYIARDNGRTYSFSLKSLPGLDDFRFGDLRSFLIGSSDGLVCFGVHHPNFFFGFNSADYADYGFYIHNPTTHLNLYVSNPLEGFRGPLTVGFGYIPYLEDYRLVILCISERSLKTLVYVYSLNSSKWWRLEAFLDIDFARSFGRGELIDNKLHWVVTRNPTGSCILGFDLVDEKFTEVPKPTSSSQFELCAIGGRLCAWDNIGGGVEVWTREQYGDWESWTLLLKLDVRAALDVRFVTYFQFIDAQRVLIQTDSSGVILVDLNENPPKYISLLVAQADIEVLSYVESLVSPLSMAEPHSEIGVLSDLFRQAKITINEAENPLVDKGKKKKKSSKRSKRVTNQQRENEQQLKLQSQLLKQLIFTEILIRLSVKPLVRCKLVSKEWESVISSPQFAKLHLRHATSSPFVQAHCFCIIYLDSFHLLNYIAYDNGRTYSFSLKSLPGLDNFRFGDLRSFLIGSSNGLVCFGVHHPNFFFGFNSADYADYGFYIHNPTTHLNLYVSNPLEGFKGPLTVGFGYIPSLEDYRLVILCISERSSKTLVYVYSLNSSKWRRLEAFLDIDFARSFGRGELIDNKLHWVVTRNPTGSCILGFDLVDEKFTEVPKPTSSSQFELCANGGRLCAWDNIGGGVEVWTREQYGDWESWTVLLKLDVRAALDVRFVTYFQFIDAQRVLIQTDSSGVILVDLNENPPKYISLLVAQADIEVLSYVESLVSPLAMAEPHNEIGVLSDLFRQATITINEAENPMVDKGKKKKKSLKRNKRVTNQQGENEQQLKLQSQLLKQLIFTEILIRLSVKPLVRCKLVSKEWESVISSPQFAKLHLRHATSSPFVQAHCFCIIYLDSFHLLNYIAYDNGRTYSFSLKSLPGLDDFRFGDLRSFLIGSSNGLVCFGVHHPNFFFGFNSADYADYGFYIHNPTTHLNLYVSNPLEGFRGPLTVGFGYIPSLEDYRLVILCISERSSKTLVYVYSLNSSKWRRLKAFLDIDFARSFGRGELIDNKLHWVVTRNPTGSCILGFDLVDEKFTEVPKPTSSSQFELCAIGGRLCAWDNIGGGVEVWTREQYGDWESWTVLLKLDVRAALDVRFVTYFQFIDAQRVLIQTDSSGVILVDLNENPPKYISLLVAQADIEVLSYVESLVSPLAMAEPHNEIGVLSDLFRQATITINEAENPLVDKGKKKKKSSKRNKRVTNQQGENKQQLKLQSQLLKQLIFTEILIRLSVKPLVRCKLVSKEWESVISSPQFAKLHLRHATSSPFVQAHCFCIISLDSFHLLNFIAYDNGRTYSFSLKSLPGLDDFRFGDLRSFLIGSSNGLVCFGVHHPNFFFGFNSADYADYGFYIHNPTTHLNLYVSNPLEGFRGPLTVGFGYIPSLEDYRLVILCISERSSKTLVYVYSLNSSKWRRLKAFLDIDFARSFGRGELIDNKLHWVVTRNPTGSCILGFDLVDEKFTEVPKPTSSSQFELCAIGGRLCAWDNIGGGVEVWTREQYGDWESWTVLLKLDVRAALDVRFVTYFQFIDAQRVLIQTDSSEVILVDLNENPPKYISLLVAQADIEVLSYVESLVSPLPPPPSPYE